MNNVIDRKFIYIIITIIILLLVIFAWSFLSPIGRYIPPTDLAVYLKFDEGSGTKAFDSSSYKNNGTIIGATWTTDCKLSSCLKFSGNAYLQIPNSTSLSFDKSQGTISMWIKPFNKSSGAYQNLVMDTNDGIEFAIQPSGNLYFYPSQAGGSNYNLVTNPLQNNVWQFLTVTWSYSTKNVSIYINGVKQASSVTNVPSYWTSIAKTGDWNIGGTSLFSGRTFNGIIDEVKIWNRVLSADEIKSEYTATSTCSDGTMYGQCSSTKPKYCNSGVLINNCAACGCPSGQSCQSDGSCLSNLVGYYKFDESSGTKAFDSSSYKNNGTLVNIGNCSSASENSPIKVSCPNGVISSIENAVYVNGSSPASCSNPDPAGFSYIYCKAADNCVGQSSCSFTVNNANCGGDPAYGFIKKLILKVSCSNSGWVNGKYGKALSFDGMNDYVSVGNLNVSGTFTVEAWAKVLDNNARAVIGSRAPSEYGFDFKFQNGNQIHGDIGNGTSWITTTADASINYQLNAWYHIVYVVTPTNFAIYINGSQVASNSYSTNVPVLSDANHRLGIGAYGGYGGEYFNGIIDEVKIWNRALSADEIKSEYTATSTCSDGTAYSSCSATKPKYCSSGTLINSCSVCGCPSGQSCNSTTNACYTPVTSICSDGTAYGQCSVTKPKYCSSGTLVDKCSQCGCPSGQSCNTTTNACYTPTTTVLKKLLFAWGAGDANSLLNKMQRSSSGWDLIIMDGPTGLSGTLVAAVKAAYPSIKVITSISAAAIANDGYNDYNTASPTYWGYQVLNPYNQYKSSAGYNGLFLDDMYPTLKPNGPTQNDINVLATWLRARLGSDVFIAPDWQTTDPSIWLFIHSFDNPNYPFPEANIDQIAAATAAGRTVVIGPFTEYTYGGTTYPDTLAGCTFTLAHFLCGLNGNLGYFSWGAIYTASGGYYPIMDMDPGTPLGPYKQVGNILYRNFTKVNVQVDLNARTGTITPHS